MFTRRKYVSGVVAVIAFGVVGAGCETPGLDNLPNVGISDAFAGKKAPEPDLKENPPLKNSARECGSPCSWSAGSPISMGTGSQFGSVPKAKERDLIGTIGTERL